jgi:hypothetical protein
MSTLPGGLTARTQKGVGSVGQVGVGFGAGAGGPGRVVELAFEFGRGIGAGELERRAVVIGQRRRQRAGQGGLRDILAEGAGLILRLADRVVVIAPAIGPAAGL